jgi:lysophospholipase L1-like esterase
MTVLFNFFLLLLIFIVIGETLWITYFGLMTRRLAKKVTPFSYKNPNAQHTILIIGDSVVLGVGAASGENSLPGRISEFYPGSTVTSISTQGGTLSDVVQQLENTSQEKATWDMIIIFSGGMDIIRFTQQTTYAKNLSKALICAKKYTKQVIYIAPPNVGLAPIFPFPVSYLYTHIARKIRTIAKKVADEHDIIHIELFKERRDDHFYNKKNLYSQDFSHPNDTGYSLWFSHIKSTLPKVD